MSQLHILKRNGTHQSVSPDKILARLDTLSFGLDRNFVDLRGLVDNIMKGLTDNLPAEKLDELMAQTAAYAVTKHPDYGLLQFNYVNTWLAPRIGLRLVVYVPADDATAAAATRARDAVPLPVH